MRTRLSFILGTLKRTLVEVSFYVNSVSANCVE